MYKIFKILVGLERTVCSWLSCCVDANKTVNVSLFKVLYFRTEEAELWRLEIKFKVDFPGTRSSNRETAFACQPKLPNDIFSYILWYSLEGLGMENVCILRWFRIILPQILYVLWTFVVIWYIFPRFGIFH
jgi:hypothetical protein